MSPTDGCRVPGRFIGNPSERERITSPSPERVELHTRNLRENMRTRRRGAVRWAVLLGATMGWACVDAPTEAGIESQAKSPANIKATKGAGAQVEDFGADVPLAFYELSL